MASLKAYRSPYDRTLGRFHWFRKRKRNINKYIRGLPEAYGYGFINLFRITPEGQFFAGLLPVKAMTIDFKNTFTAYDSDFEVFRDFLQPLRGLGNIISGIYNAFAALGLFLFNVIYITYKSILMINPKRSIPNYSKAMIGNAGQTIGDVANALTTIARGILQFLTSPLIIPRVAFRDLLTLAGGKRSFKKEIQHDLKKCEKLLNKVKQYQDEDNILRTEKEQKEIKKKEHSTYQSLHKLTDKIVFAKQKHELREKHFKSLLDCCNPTDRDTEIKNIKSINIHYQENMPKYNRSLFFNRKDKGIWAYEYFDNEQINSDVQQLITQCRQL